MADRYWVGGTGAWNATNTANWSASTGGASGASVPTSADNVFFDVNSNTGTSAFTVTPDATIAIACNNFTASGLDATMTFTFGSASQLNVSGNWTSPATGLTTSALGTIAFISNGTQSINANGGTIATIVQIGTGTSTGTVNLGGAITIGAAATTQNLVLRSGTFNTQNFALSVFAIDKIASGNITFNLGTSTLTFTGSAARTIINITATGLTFNAGTSTTIVQTSGAFTKTVSSIQDLTFYNFNYTTGATNIDALLFTGTAGTYTFNNFTVQGLTSSGNKQVQFGQNATINGTFTHTSTTPFRRLVVRSSGFSGYPLTLNCGAYNLENVDVFGINVTGTALTGLNIGDGGNNTGNITFRAPQTFYYNITGNANRGSNCYATTLGGTPSTADFALPQDTLIFNNAYFPTSVTFTWGLYLFNPAVDASGVTTTPARTMQFTNATTVFLCGNLTWAAPYIVIGTGTGAVALTTIGTNKTNEINIPNIGYGQFVISGYNNGTIKLLRNLSLNQNTFTCNIYRGTLDLNGFSFSCGSMTLLGATPVNAFTCAFGTNGSLILRAATGLVTNGANTSWSYTGTGTIQGSTVAFLINNAIGQSFPKIGLTGAAIPRIVNSCTVDDIYNLTPGTTCQITLSNGITVTVNNFTLSGTAGFLASIRSQTAGTRGFLSKASGVVSCDYLSIQDSGAQGGATWYAGANSTNVSNNAGWIFTAPPGGYTAGGQFMAFF